MGRSKVTAKWLVISMASSSGSTSKRDVGCHLTAIIDGIDVTRCGVWGGQLRAHALAWMEL